MPTAALVVTQRIRNHCDVSGAELDWRTMENVESCCYAVDTLNSLSKSHSTGFNHLRKGQGCHLLR